MIFGGDPLFLGDIDAGVVIVVLVKTLVAFAALMVSVLFMVWFERKVVSDMQSRIGPNRAGPWGLLQTLADGIKLFFKEDLLPDRANRRIFKLAPYLSLVPAFLAFAVVPIGGEITVAGHTTRLQLADPPMGILFLLAVSSVAVYGVMLAGWASGSKYPLLGSVRASAQMVSYEAALGLSVATVVLVTGSLLTSDIVADQSGGTIFDWNLFRLGFVPFVIFAIAATAELNRPPFDLVEAEQELVGGFNTEYSSLRFALFFLAEFMGTVTWSAVIVTLFLGGPAGPAPDGGFLGAVVPVGWFLAKVLVFLFTYVWLRATLPRFRYDQLMDLGWKKLIPASLFWLLVMAAARVERWYVALGFVAGILVLVAMLRALNLGRDRARVDVPLSVREV
ncbi:MAG TPA: NADH-quinone oxidoreductase subunit NuoH [Acidimicrobiales bacterium]|nr:NADH-quinone oxidoreductase subunit NuoH [Acidimicrobiales bacterium]